MSNVILKNVVKRFGSVTALDKLSITSRNREFAVLVGPSGAARRPRMAADDPATGAREGNTVTARADVVETLGSEIFVYLTCGAITSSPGWRCRTAR